MGKKKDLHIETLRSLAIIIVVIGHTIGSAPDGGMKIDFPSLWRYAYLWISYIQMPLFVAIAGWVYALKPIKKTKDIPRFLKKKFQRLIIPMLIAGSLYYLLQNLTPGTNKENNLHDIWKITILPYTYYWYLQALFILFIIQILIDAFHLTDSLKRWLIGFCFCFLLLIIEEVFLKGRVTNFFSFMGAMYYLPAFSAGIGLARFKQKLYSNNFKYFYIACTLIGIALIQIKWFRFELYSNHLNLIAAFASICTVALILHTKWQNTTLTKMAKYTFWIYLLHGFGTAGGRIAINKFGIDSTFIIFIASATIGIIAPIITKLLYKNLKKKITQ